MKSLCLLENTEENQFMNSHLAISNGWLRTVIGTSPYKRQQMKNTNTEKDTTVTNGIKKKKKSRWVSCPDIPPEVSTNDESDKSHEHRTPETENFKVIKDEI